MPCETKQRIDPRHEFCTGLLEVMRKGEETVDFLAKQFFQRENKLKILNSEINDLEGEINAAVKPNDRWSKMRELSKKIAERDLVKNELKDLEIRYTRAKSLLAENQAQYEDKCRAFV